MQAKERRERFVQKTMQRKLMDRIHREKQKQLRVMEEAINKCNFALVQQLVDDEGVPMDHATAEGFTAWRMDGAIWLVDGMAL